MNREFTLSFDTGNAAFDDGNAPADRARRAKVRREKRARFAVVVLSVLAAVGLFYGAASAIGA